MSNLSSEILAELNRRRIIEEVDQIRLEEQAAGRNKLVSKKLAALGEWMIARGEKLRQSNATAQSNYSELNKKVI